MLRVSGYFTGFVCVVMLLSGCKGESPIGKWKNGVVPYYLSGAFTDDEVATIREAMDSWEAEADVRFVEVSPRASAYKIIKVNQNTWSSSVGENNSDCHMIFGNGGNVSSHVLHELGHALGLLHEHQRPDRDRFIRILWQNLITQYKTNYELEDNPLITEERYDYDYNSIMHYPANSFSSDGFSNTMESLDSGKPINRLNIITTLDADKVREIYGPPQD